MLSIRFSRKGKRKQPIYRLIVTEKSRDPWGKYLENLGFYNPKTKVAELKAERIKYWLAKGAQASPTVFNLLVTKEIITGAKVRASKSKPGKKKQVELAAKKAQAKAEADAKTKAETEANQKVQEEATKAADSADVASA